MTSPTPPPSDHPSDEPGAHNPATSLTESPGDERDNHNPATSLTESPNDERDDDEPVTSLTEGPGDERDDHEPVTSLTESPSDERDDHQLATSLTESPSDERDDHEPVTSLTESPSDEQGDHQLATSLIAGPTDERGDREPGVSLIGGGIDGRRAWGTVVAAFVASAVTLGTAYSFGAFFESMSEEFGSERGATAVIFGITTFTFFGLSIGTGRLMDRHGPRIVLLLGALAMSTGLLLTSRVQSLEVGYITYGAGVGIAAACGYVPMVAMVGGWFDRLRAVAVGLAVAGIGIGTMVLSPLAAALIDRYGWRDTYVIFGIGGALALLAVIPLAGAAPGDGGPQPSRFADALGNTVFRRLQLSAFCLGLALFVPFVFVGQYAKDRGIGSVQAAVLVGLLGGSSVVSRIGFGSLVRRFGAFRLYRACLAIHGAAFAVWFMAGSSYAVLVVFVLVLGAGYGGFVALGPIVVADLMGVAGLGSMLGLLYTAPGLGALIGAPTAGWIIDRTDTYRWSIAVCIIAAAVSVATLTGLPTSGDGRLRRADNAKG